MAQNFSIGFKLAEYGGEYGGRKIILYIKYLQQIDKSSAEIYGKKHYPLSPLH
ncbi:MAG TPA: hypothetical protein QKA14_02390 [Candidatus Megaira endosymbiont of Hartmannula sinica]|nr:hypothetical protein [Candidatus Megaera endosymbiont of Hartmannula sinica]